MKNFKSKEDNEFKKIKVTSAEIVVHGNENKPYYEIKYYPIDDGECHIGYSSYNLKMVFNWLKECFDIVNMEEPTTNPFDSLHCTIAFDVKDWSTDRRNAWIYGIIIGWGDTEETKESIFQEFNKEFKWTRETWNRLQLLHEEYLKYKKLSGSNF